MAFWNKPKAPATDWEAKFKQAVKDLATRDEELDAAEKRIEGLQRDAVMRAGRNKDLTDALVKAEAEIARLKPLAEATERRRANDAKRVRPSRAKKGEAKPVAKFTKPIPEPKPAPKAKPAAKAAGTKRKGARQ